MCSCKSLTCAHVCYLTNQTLGGVFNEFIFSGRLDNLHSSYCAVTVSNLLLGNYCLKHSWLITFMVFFELIMQQPSIITLASYNLLHLAGRTITWILSLLCIVCHMIHIFSCARFLPVFSDCTAKCKKLREIALGYFWLHLKQNWSSSGLLKRSQFSILLLLGSIRLLNAAVFNRCWTDSTEMWLIFEIYIN